MLRWPYSEQTPLRLVHESGVESHCATATRGTRSDRLGPV